MRGGQIAVIGGAARRRKQHKRAAETKDLAAANLLSQLGGTSPIGLLPDEARELLRLKQVAAAESAAVRKVEVAAAARAIVEQDGIVPIGMTKGEACVLMKLRQLSQEEKQNTPTVLREASLPAKPVVEPVAPVLSTLVPAIDALDVSDADATDGRPVPHSSAGTRPVQETSPSLQQHEGPLPCHQAAQLPMP